jgi:hypothetical protein
MPLLPIEEYTADLWIDIENSAPDNNHAAYDSCQRLLAYFVDTWFDEYEAKFEREIWNQYGNQEARTNNHLEGWHSSFNKKIKIIHPTLFSFIEHLKTAQNDAERNVLLLSNGNNIVRKNQTYARINQQIVNLWTRLDFNSQNPISCLDFLDRVGYLAHKKV